MKFTIDGSEYNALVTSLNRKARVAEGKLSGDSQSGERIIDRIGTYYSYDMTIATDRLSVYDYDALYSIITSPDIFHVVKMPFGRKDYLEFDAYITSADDSLIRATQEGRCWGNLKVSFFSMRPQRVPGDAT